MARSTFARRAYNACRQIPLVGPLAHAGVDKLLPHGSRAWTRLPEGLGKGLWFYSDPRFELGYGNGDHEPWVQELLRRYLTSGDCFFDVGGHTGFFSLIAARIVGEEGSVVALEADPENAELLRTNAARNVMPQVCVIQAAVWSSCDELTFQRASAASNRTEGHVADGRTDTGSAIRVLAITLDHLLFNQHVRPPKLVKIDIEGGEWEALQGAKRILLEMNPYLLIEVHNPATIDPLESFLRGFGYSATHWQPVHHRYPEYKQQYIWATCEQGSKGPYG